MAIAGTTIVVGLRDDAHGGFLGAGSAYVFVRSGSTWTEQAILRASAPSQGAALGHSVAIDGDTIVAGAYHESHSSLTRAGSAYVFVRSGTTWSEQTILRASDAAAEDELGFAVAIDGDTVIAGAAADDAPGSVDVGSAYVFVRSGTAWTQQAILRASDAGNWAYFGGSVGIDADTVIAGAFGQAHSGLVSAGSAYVYARAGSTWSEQAILHHSGAASGDDFGTSVAIEGGLAIVGAPGVDWAGAGGAGSAYVFERAGTGWSEASIARPPTPEAALSFGYAVGLSANTAIAGAYAEDSPGRINAGAAHVIALHAIGQACTGASDCTSGFCVDGVCCDTACGGGTPSDCAACSVAAGAAVDGVCAPLAAGRVCRGVAGTCDVQEVCDGASRECPADALATPGAVCRAAGGPCDIEETCTGSSATCPGDGFVSAGTVCRVADGPCDANERCTGSSAACPFDLPASAATVCRPAAGECDVAERCTGTSFECPADALASSDVTCRVAEGPCDVAEACTGASPDCPGDDVLGAGAVCRAAAGACDVAETCSGAGVECPSDARAPDGAACDDGSACTEGACMGGSCVSSSIDCDDGDPCTADGCAEASGCFHDPVVGCMDNGGAPDAGALDAGARADAAISEDAGQDAGGPGDGGLRADAAMFPDAAAREDAAVPADAALPADAAGDAGSPTIEAGCGCRSTRAPKSTPVAALLVAVALVARRRRRAR